MSRKLTSPDKRRMLRSPGDSRSQTQRGGGIGWREATDHAESVFDAARRRLPRFLRIRVYRRIKLILMIEESAGQPEPCAEGGGMGWREAPDHAESVFDAARRRLPRLLNHQNKSQS